MKQITCLIGAIILSCLHAQGSSQKAVGAKSGTSPQKQATRVRERQKALEMVFEELRVLVEDEAGFDEKGGSNRAVMVFELEGITREGMKVHSNIQMSGTMQARIGEVTAELKADERLGFAWSNVNTIELKRTDVPIDPTPTGTETISVIALELAFKKPVKKKFETVVTSYSTAFPNPTKKTNEENEETEITQIYFRKRADAQAAADLIQQITKRLAAAGQKSVKGLP